jgi:hypothetical protein
MNPPRKPILFISCAHADEPERPGPEEIQWLTFVTGYLRPALKHGAVEIWVDRLMRGGEDWDQEIERKLRACDIFILLCSRHSLSSDYVVDKEIAIIRERQANGENVHFYPLLLTPTPKIALELVRDKNLRPKDAKPFSGFSLHERYEKMTEAADEIAEIAREIAEAEPMAILHQVGSGRSAGDPPYVLGVKSLEIWLRGQSREVAAAIAARAALRVAPLVIAAKPKRKSAKATRLFANLTSAVFRASALARVAAKYPASAKELRRAADAAAFALTDFSPAADVAYFAAHAAFCAAEIVGLADRAFASRAKAAAYAADASADVAGSIPGAYSAAVWSEIRADIASILADGVRVVMDRPLWSTETPKWASSAWIDLKSSLPPEENWEVWMGWYQQRLDGGSRGEAYEFVAATASINVWRKGASAANAWIREHLPKDAPPVTANGLPQPIPDLEAPFTYNWNLSYQIAITAGLQNLAFFPHFRSEEDHRHNLEACRLGAERLLKTLRQGRYNIRGEYAEALQYYFDDLPKTAGAGNILLAHDHALDLREMFLADADQLPAPVASRLERVISNQFALDGFYDLVQRHNAAVAAANWTQPFPTDAAKRFFGVVADNTPAFFQPEVAEGVRRIEGVAAAERAAKAEGVPSSAPQPPPLPAGASEPAKSREHQVATSANALYDVFLKGKDLPLSVEDWAQVAHSLGDAIGPILHFLKAEAVADGPVASVAPAPRKPARRRAAARKKVGDDR